MLKKAPSIYPLEYLQSSRIDECMSEISGKWVPARHLGFYSLLHRIKCAYLVFTGRCDLVKWPGQ
jgi:hypothetical protein